MTWERKETKIELPPLKCAYCGLAGLSYLCHTHVHCEAHACCSKCQDCQDWFKAIGEPCPTPTPTQGETMPHAPDAPANPQDKQAYCEYGVKKEKEFIDFFDTHVEKDGVIINPDKAKDKFVPDIVLYGELADLKAQRTPFFTAARHKMDPRYTVTFNKKDVDRYSLYYPHLHIVFWVDWKTTEWKNIKVEETHAIYLATFAQVEALVKNAPLHEYKDRKNDRAGNARSSYLLDVRNFTQIYPPEDQELFTQREQAQTPKEGETHA